MSHAWAKYGQPVLELLLPSLLVTIALSILAAALVALAAKRRFGEMLLYLSPFAWLGGVTGVIAGASQEAIVGAFVTGVLTLVTGLFSFVFAKDALSEWRPVLSVAVVLLCISAVVGLSLGRIHRSGWDTYQREHAIWKTRFDKVHVPAMATQLRYDYCRQNISRANIQQCEALLIK